MNTQPNYNTYNPQQAMPQQTIQQFQGQMPQQMPMPMNYQPQPYMAPPQQQAQPMPLKEPYYQDYAYLGFAITKQGIDKNGKNYIKYKLMLKENTGKETQISCFGDLSPKSKKVSDLVPGETYGFGIKYKSFVGQFGPTVGREVFWIGHVSNAPRMPQNQPSMQPQRSESDVQYNVYPIGDAPNPSAIADAVKEYIANVPVERRNLSHFIGFYIGSRNMMPNLVAELIKQFNESIQATLQTPKKE